MFERIKQINLVEVEIITEVSSYSCVHNKCLLYLSNSSGPRAYISLGKTTFSSKHSYALFGFDSSSVERRAPTGQKHFPNFSDPNSSREHSSWN